MINITAPVPFFFRLTNCKPFFLKSYSLFRLLFGLAFAFKAETCLNPLKWILAMIMRVGIIALFAFYEDWILHLNGYFDILVLPFCAFMLWYFATTLFMALGVLYFERKLDYNSVQTGFNEISRFLDWRDNKMKFMSYTDAQDLMRDTAILNNLDSSNPEARRQLDYINNKLRFMSYTEGLDFLRGKV